MAKGKMTSVPTKYVVFALVVPLVIYFGFSAAEKALEMRRLNQEADQIRLEIDSLKAENAQLRKQIEYLNSDAFVEKVAREELNLIKAGDKAVVVIASDSKREVDKPTGAALGQVDDTPNWLRWWNSFFG